MNRPIITYRLCSPPRGRARSGGFSLLELILAATLLATLMSAVSVVIRGSYQGWLRHTQEGEQVENSCALLRHFTRQLRQCDRVVSISTPGSSGRLEIMDSEGRQLGWHHNPDNRTVEFGLVSSPALLAREIEELAFTGYEMDGVTVTTLVDRIQSVECRVTVSGAESGSPPRTFAGRAWIRRW